MQAQDLRRALEELGLVVLDVAASHADPGQLYVYLHGPAGQWVDGHAREVIAAVPGVVDVQPSHRSDVIFVVTVEKPIDQRASIRAWPREIR